MKTKLKCFVIALALLSALNSQLSTAFAQGTAFTYSGQLQNSGSNANGSYDLQFTLYNAIVAGSQSGPILTNATAVRNGLFTVTLDFGSGIFAGTTFWLDIAARTNGTGAFAELSPRQQLTPTPYAIYAETSTVLSGPSSITINAGTGLGGGGEVALGASTTLNNTGVLSVAGNADITASMAEGAVTLGDNATSSNTPSTIVKRDSSGNFSAGTITLSGNLILPDVLSGPNIIYAGTVLLLYSATEAENFFVGPVAGNSKTTGDANTAAGVSALSSDTTGSGNTATGVTALANTTTGSFNTANGYEALYKNTTGSNNAANGSDALFSNTTGSDNTANGYSALHDNTSGSFNTANGFDALFSNLSGSDNTANGYEALYENTNGAADTA
ncbi:MAG TPA: hypothetical protein VMQ67_09060, partial [Candidatus Saccharimonadales bacterium]|nr:hypothetical protein [Candidatus Saccharimonadales bacterium]